MPLLRVDATAHGPRHHGPGALQASLATELSKLGPGDPVVVLVHGFKFSPAPGGTDPHGHIFSLTPPPRCRKAVSWPRHLGFGCGAAGEGLCIAFGWEARGSLWQAWRRAEAAGAALAEVIAMVRRLRPGRPVDMVGHSLGARVCLAALTAAPAASVGRAILLAAAEFRGTALRAMAAPAGHCAEVINVTTRENDLFDAAVEWLVRAPERGDRVLGAGLAAPRWLDIQIDAGDTRAALARLGYKVPAPTRRICHWSGYLRAGLFPFYADLLRDRERLSLEELRRSLPTPCDPRWARFGTAVLRLPARGGRGLGLAKQP